MNPTEFFAQVNLKDRFKIPEKDDDYVGLIYDLGGDLWQGVVRQNGMQFQGTGRTVAECFEILLHGLRKHELIEDPASPQPNQGAER